jgi:hypothetical protein
MKKFLCAMLVLCVATLSQATVYNTVDFAFGAPDGSTIYTNGTHLSLTSGANFDLGVFVKITSATGFGSTFTGLEILAGYSSASTRGGALVDTSITNRLGAVGFANVVTEGWNVPSANNVGGGKNASLATQGSAGSRLAMTATVAQSASSWYHIADLQLMDMMAGGGEYTITLWRAATPATGGWSSFITSGANQDQEAVATTLEIQNLDGLEADAGGPYTVDKGGTRNLSGYAMVGNGETITSWLWDLNNDGVFNDATGEFPNLSYDYLVNSLGLSLGQHTIGLKVIDNYGISDIAYTTLTILPEPLTFWLFIMGGLGFLRRRS